MIGSKIIFRLIRFAAYSAFADNSLDSGIVPLKDEVISLFMGRVIFIFE